MNPFFEIVFDRLNSAKALRGKSFVSAVEKQLISNHSSYFSQKPCFPWK